MKASPLLLAAGLALGSVPATAHHSFAMFDYKQSVTLDGVVKELDWNNPHIWITVAVQNPQGVAEDWRIEAGSPQNMLRQGWKRELLQPGEKVTFVGHPMRNGDKAASLTSAKFANGETAAMGLTGSIPQGEAHKAYTGDFKQN
jgi:hypothetical protein